MVDYCTMKSIKIRLNISLDDSQFDDELTESRDEAEAYIDIKLSNHTTVPLTTVPELLKHACADLAAGLFQRRRQPLSEIVDVKTGGVTVNVFWMLGNEKLEAYIKQTYKEGDLKRV